MKKRIYFHYIILFVFCQCLALLGLARPTQASSYDNFYIESFTADYYVSKNEDGAAKMHVREEIVAVFPDYDQNHGIVRAIPYTNADGKNITVKSRDSLNLKVTRNGNPENIYSVDYENNHYVFKIRNESDNVWVHGRQVYVLEYDFDNVVLHYDSAGHVTFTEADARSSELYWNTNGTNWKQSFGTLIANVHFLDDLNENLTGETSCYVGARGQKGMDRCTTSATSDGFQFEASNLSAGENLTFDISIDLGTFAVVAPPYSYDLIIYTIAVAVITVIIFVCSVLIRRRNSEKHLFYKGHPVAPQYLPPKDLSFTEISELSIKPVYSPKVAILINLAVNGKIELVKSDKKSFGSYRWTINLKDITSLTDEENSVLQLLYGGPLPVSGTSFEVKSQRYSVYLESVEKNMTLTAKQSLLSKGLTEETGKERTSNKTQSKGPSVPIIVLTTFIIVFFLITSGFLASRNGNCIVVGEPFMSIISVLLIIAMVAFMSCAFSFNDRYAKRTKAGLEQVVYLDGLRLYMKMAEADRLAVLQSVEGVDTSPEGVVKLYEKLLPYAILFKVEKSWLEELNKYYANCGTSPTWYCGQDPFFYSDFHSFSSSSSSSISSGSGSSSDSGSGGGGSSGGGGGGGGGGGC